MKLVSNSGADRVIDLLRPHLQSGSQLGCVTPTLSLFAFAELRHALASLAQTQLILPLAGEADEADEALEFLGSEGGGDRIHRNQLQARWLANQCAQWLSGGKVQVRRAPGRVPQGAAVLRAPGGTAQQVVLGSFAFSTDGLGLTPGIIFCLRAEGDVAAKGEKSDYPLAPLYLAHVGDDGAVLLPYTQAKRILDRLKRLALGRELPDDGACAAFDRATRHGENMGHAQQLLAAAVASVVGKSAERAVASLFSPGGTHALKGEYAGSGDFEVLAFMVILPSGGAA